jgi:hypothetical protein
MRHPDSTPTGPGRQWPIALAALPLVVVREGGPPMSSAAEQLVGPPPSRRTTMFNSMSRVALGRPRHRDPTQTGLRRMQHPDATPTGPGRLWPIALAALTFVVVHRSRTRTSVRWGGPPMSSAAEQLVGPPPSRRTTKLVWGLWRFAEGRPRHPDPTQTGPRRMWRRPTQTGPGRPGHPNPDSPQTEIAPRQPPERRRIRARCTRLRPGTQTAPRRPPPGPAAATRTGRKSALSINALRGPVRAGIRGRFCCSAGLNLVDSGDRKAVPANHP